MTVGCRSANGSGGRCAMAMPATSASARSVATKEAPRTSVELDARRRLRGAERPRGDGGCRIVLALDRPAGEPAEHRQLAGVRQRIGNRALEQALGGPAERLVRS